MFTMSLADGRKKVEIGPSGSCQMTFSVSLDRYGNRTVFVGEKEVPQTCPVLDSFSPSLPSSEDLSALLTYIDEGRNPGFEKGGCTIVVSITRKFLRNLTH